MILPETGPHPAKAPTLPCAVPLLAGPPCTVSTDSTPYVLQSSWPQPLVEAGRGARAPGDRSGWRVRV